MVPARLKDHVSILQKVSIDIVNIDLAYPKQVVFHERLSRHNVSH
jgi:hypothetical protein